MDLAVEARRRGRKLKILVTRLRFLGDVIITTPVLEALGRKYPGAEICYLAQPGYADILRNHPVLRGIIELQPGIGGFHRTVSLLRKMRFIAAIDLFYNPASANLLFLSGIPVRIGGRRRFREKLYTSAVDVPPGVKSAVDHHLYFLKAVDIEISGAIPKVYLDDNEREKGRAVVDAIRGKSRCERIVAIVPGGKWPVKRWAPEYFAALADLVREKAGAHCVVITGPGEEKIVGRLVGEAKGDIETLSPRAVRDVALIIESCDAVVANDGGIMHLAVALGRPTVALFGPTDPAIWFPYEEMGPFRVLTAGRECSPCDRHTCGDMGCMEDIGPSDVADELLSAALW
ncbi:MAG: glycosyltransferase family 9 protein [Candidatus Krumholzibacteriota bacterium]|nr:glycosyltransferase family 9 protein [Candidatus Krumholzibacteriota bacterium]